jgi:hypothetical protein
VGRPPKPKEPVPNAKLKRGRGRPPLPLSCDPERYFLALLSAHIEIGKLSGVSEGRVSTTFAGFVFGRPVHTPENVSDMERTGRYQVGMRWLQGVESEEWRGMNSFRPIAETLMRKLRRIRAKPSSHPDWKWLRAMTLAWRTCLWGELRHLRQAGFLAASVGEAEYFNATMRPLLAERAAQRKAGATRSEVSPEFMTNLIRTTVTDGCAK